MPTKTIDEVYSDLSRLNIIVDFLELRITEGIHDNGVYNDLQYEVKRIKNLIEFMGTYYGKKD